MIASLARTRDPNHAILAFNGHAILAVIEIQHFARLKEQFHSWGFRR
jgi:hypothetical protein